MAVRTFSTHYLPSMLEGEQRTICGRNCRCDLKMPGNAWTKHGSIDVTRVKAEVTCQPCLTAMRLPRS